MAYYVRAAGGNSNTAATWSTTSSAGSAAGSTPTAADDVILDSGSGNLTINAAMVCRSIDCNGFTGTVTHNASVTLTIGDGTAGAGNIALRLASGMTYTKAATSSAISFISTSATQQTITTNGKTVGNVTFNASSNGSWQLSDSLTGITSSVLNLTKGSLDTNSVDVSFGSFTSTNSNVRSLTLGTSNLTFSSTGAAWNTSVSSNLTYSGSSASITLSGSNAGFYSGNTINAVTWTGAGTNLVQGTTFTNLTVTGIAAKTNAFKFYAATTITGTLTLNGNSATNRLWVTTDTGVRTITAAAVSASYIDVTNITGAGAASWDLSAITGNSGDAGGNSGITFTTAATQTATGTASFTWSSHGWTSRVPLPQDNVVISNSFIASRVITVDMPRIGKDITCSCTGSPTFTLAGNCESYGSIDLTGIGATSGGLTWTAKGRGSQTITSNGVTWNNTLEIDGSGGTYTLQDAFTSNNDLTSTNGTFVANNFNVTLAHYSNGTGNKTLTMGSGTWTLTGTGTVWSTTSGITLNANTSTIVISNTSGTGKTFGGASRTYNNLTCSGDVITITGNNTFNNLAIDTAGRTTGLRITSGSTQTVTSLSTNGSAGNLATLISSSAGSAGTISKSSGTVSLDYMSIKDSTATGGASFYAGANSTNVSGNTGWSFTVPSQTYDETGSGGAYGAGSGSVYKSVEITVTANGLLAAGTSGPQVTYALTTSGSGLYAASSATVAKTTEVSITANGLLAASSSEPQATYVLDTSGSGLACAGAGENTIETEVTIAANGLVAAGVAEVAKATEVSIEAAGVAVDGSAFDQTVFIPNVAANGVVVAGAAVDSVVNPELEAAGVLADGSANSETVFNPAASSNGAIAASSADTQATYAADITASGLLADGSADYQVLYLVDIVANGAVVSGSASVTVDAAASANGVLAAGVALNSGQFGYLIVANGATAGGTASVSFVGTAPTYSDCECGPQEYQETMSGGAKCSGSALVISTSERTSGGIVASGSATVSTNQAWDGFDRVYHLLEQGAGVAGEYIDQTGKLGGKAGIEPRTLEVQEPTRKAGIYIYCQEFYGSEWIQFPATEYPYGSDLTVSLWAKTTSDFLPRMFFSKGKTDSTGTTWQDYSMVIGHDGDKKPFVTLQTISDTGTWRFRTATGSARLSKGCWKHLSAVYTAGNSLKLYVDGVQVATTAVPEKRLAPSNAGNFMARLNQAQYAQGQMSELRITPEAKSVTWLRTEFINGCDQRAYTYGVPENPVYS